MLSVDDYMAATKMGSSVRFFVDGRPLKPWEDISQWQRWQIDVRPRLRGGKGGFGALLKKEGRRIQKDESKPSLRTILGERQNRRNDESAAKLSRRSKKKEKLKALLSPKADTFLPPRSSVQFRLAGTTKKS